MRKIFYFIVITGIMFVFNRYSNAQVISKKSNSPVVPLFTIDITKEYPNKEFVLQDMADIEYIKLETRKDVLLDFGNHFCISDSLIVTYNVKEGSVFIFNRRGKVLTMFNHIGRAGEEYQAINKLTVDFNKQEIFIYDLVQKYKIMVYDYEGRFKRVLKIPYHVWIDIMFDYNSEFLICYDAYGVGAATEINTKPYFLLSKQDGRVLPLPIFLKNRMNSALSIKKNKISQIYSESQVIGMPVYPLIRNGKNVYIADWSCDTLFRLSEGKLEPILIKKPSGILQAPQILCYAAFKTSRYTLLTSVEKILTPSILKERKIPSIDLMCDHKTGRFYKPTFINKDYVVERNYTIDAIGMELPENSVISCFPAHYLLEDLKTGKLSGKLKEMVSTLDEEDNPVLMLVKFKE